LLVVLFLYTFLTLIMTYPLFWVKGEAVFDPGDPLFNAYVLSWDYGQKWWDPRELEKLFAANIMYPAGASLALSEHLLGDMPLVWMVRKSGGNPILAYNVVLLVSFVLSGFFTFLLAHLWLKDTYAAFLAGVLFAFCPARVGQLGHLQILTVQWTPLALLFLELFFRSGQIRHLLGFLLAYAWQYLSSFYLGYFLSLLVAAYIFHSLWFFRRHQARQMWRLQPGSAGRKIERDDAGRVRPSRSSRPIPRRLLQRTAVLTAGLTLTFFLVLWPVARPYLQVKEEWGLQRALWEPIAGSADLVTSYLTAPPENRLYGWLSLYLASRFNPWEKFLFPGLVPLGLAFYALYVRRAPPRSLPQQWPAGSAPAAEQTVDFQPEQRLVSRARVRSVQEMGAASAGERTAQQTAVSPAQRRPAQQTGVAPTAERPAQQLAISHSQLRTFGKPKLPAGQRAAFQGSLYSERGPSLFAFLGLVSFILSGGPLLTILDRWTPIPLPYLLFHYLIPGFSSMRVPARLGIMTQLALALLAGDGWLAWEERQGVVVQKRSRKNSQGVLPAGVPAFAGHSNRFSRFSPRGRALFRGLVLLLALIEQISFPLPVYYQPDANPRPYQQWLRDNGEKLPLIELPATGQLEDREELLRQVNYTFSAGQHYQPTANGYSGFWPGSFFLLQKRAAAFPQAEAVLYLAAAGVRRFVLHLGPLKTERRVHLEEELGKSPYLWLEADFGDVRIYRLREEKLAGARGEAATEQSSVKFPRPCRDGNSSTPRTATSFAAHLPAEATSMDHGATLMPSLHLFLPQRLTAGSEINLGVVLVPPAGKTAVTPRPTVATPTEDENRRGGEWVWAEVEPWRGRRKALQSVDGVPQTHPWQKPVTFMVGGEAMKDETLAWGQTSPLRRAHFRASWLKETGEEVLRQDFLVMLPPAVLYAEGGAPHFSLPSLKVPREPGLYRLLVQWIADPGEKGGPETAESVVVGDQTIPTSASAPELLAASYQNPDVERVGKTLNLDRTLLSIDLVNNGQAVWLSHPVAGVGQVFLRYRWLEGEREVAQGEVPLLADVFPGQTYRLRRELLWGPPSPGRFQLEVELVSRYFAAFSQVGTPPLRLTVEVTGFPLEKP